VAWQVEVLHLDAVPTENLRKMAKSWDILSSQEKYHKMFCSLLAQAQVFEYVLCSDEGGMSGVRAVRSSLHRSLWYK
jgi:hypothetical protein